MTNPPEPIDAATLSKSVILRDFVPSKDFEQSQKFYGTIGFQVSRKNERIALVSLSETGTGFSFLLEDFHETAFAENLMLQIVVSVLPAWLSHLSSQFDKRFGVKSPKPPVREPWGGDVAHFWDPAGLWHVASLEGT
jgi:hypothetical protein